MQRFASLNLRHNNASDVNNYTKNVQRIYTYFKRYSLDMFNALYSFIDERI